MEFHLALPGEILPIFNAINIRGNFMATHAITSVVEGLKNNWWLTTLDNMINNHSHSSLYQD